MSSLLTTGCIKGLCGPTSQAGDPGCPTNPPPATGGGVGGLPGISIHTDLSDSSCTCGEAEHIYNITGRKAQVIVHTTQSSVANGSTGFDYPAMTMPANSDYKLGCSAAPSDNINLACDVTIGFSVKSINWLTSATPPTRTDFVAGSTFRGPSMVEAVVYRMASTSMWIEHVVNGSAAMTPQRCAAACKDYSPACSIVPLTNETKIMLRPLAKMLGQPEGTAISQKQLLSTFALSEDPCSRSDTEMKGGRLINSGISCTLSSALDTRVGAGVSVELKIPETLEAVRTISGSEVSLAFNSPDTSVRLVVSDASLNSMYGGEVRNVSVSSNGNVIVTLPNSCLLAESKSALQ